MSISTKEKEEKKNRSTKDVKSTARPAYVIDDNMG